VWGRRDMTVGSWLENPMERDNAENMAIDWSVILKCFKEKVCNRVDCILLAVDRDKWPGFVSCTGHSISISCGAFLD
jgi:hypothetical protein